MKNKAIKIILIVLVIVILLALINIIRNYSIIKEIRDANIEFKENFSKVTNFSLLKETKSTGESGYMNVKIEIYYKDGIYLDKEEGNINDTKATVITWFDYNTQQGIKIHDNTEEEVESKDMDSSKGITLINTLDEITDKDVFETLFTRYLFKPIVVKEDCYIFSDDGTDTYVNKETKLVKKVIGENISETQEFKEGVVKDTDVEKPNQNDV